MTVIQKKKLKYEILEEVCKNLEERLLDTNADLENYVKHYTDPDTGEIDKTCWYYSASKDLENKIQMIAEVVDMISKL